MSEGVRVVDRVFDILEILATHKGGISLSQIAAETSMSKTTVHRLLATMLSRQYVEHNEDGSYTLGYKFIETASNHINNLELITEAKPLLSRMLWDLNLTTHLGVLEGANVVYMEKMDVYPNTRLYTQVGYRSPAYCSSMGKCLLACLSGDELDRVLSCCKFEQHTPNTIVDKDKLKQQLKEVRVAGWAMDNEEYQLGHRCIGAPVFDYRGSAVAAISASGPISQLTDERVEVVKREVKSAAKRLSRRMGFSEI